MSADKENEEIRRKRKSFSEDSLTSISLHSTGQKLGENELKWLSLKVTEDIKELLNESGKYARRTRDDRVRLSHIQHAARTLCPDVFSRLLLRGKLLENPVKVIPAMNSTQRTPEARIMQVNGDRIYKPENSLAVQIPPNAPLDSLWLRKKRAGWMRQEQALLMPCKNIPLSKEQLEFYKMILQSSVGALEAKRQLALHALSTDPTVEVLLVRLTASIADAVFRNVARQRVLILFYLLRMVRALFSNKSLNLDKYLHIILPAVLSCLLADPIVLSVSMADHWSLREYSGSIVTEIVRRYEDCDRSLMPRVIGIYKKGLMRKSLTTMYGAVIGLGKMGNDAVRAYILPNLKYLSKRIEPHLMESQAFSITSLDTLASKFISHRLMKMCTPLLDCNPQDSPVVFSSAYGLLGPMLRLAVLVARVKADAERAAKAKVSRLPK